MGDDGPVVADRVESQLAGSSIDDVATFTSALKTLEFASLAGRSVRRFSSLGPDAARQAAAKARRARTWIVRDAAERVSAACLTRWAALPGVEQAIGFEYDCVTTGLPREVAPLEVLGAREITTSHTDECDVVIVGSGAGGSVAAAALAQRGLSVIVVEQGSSRTKSDFAGSPVDRVRPMTVVRRVRGSPGIRVVNGTGVGGTTLVSYGSSYRPPAAALAALERGAEALGPYLERVDRTQHVEGVPAELEGRSVELLRSAARQRMAHAGGVRRAAPGCRGCGTCSAGCPSDAKGSTHVTYLPAAQRAGATIYANARVDRIVIEDGAAAGIEATMLDAASGEPTSTLTINARAVVLAAGALGTPALLQANALGNRSGLLGRSLSLTPSVRVGAFFDAEILGWQGVMQSFAIDEWLDEHGVMIESVGVLPSLDVALLAGAGEALRSRVDRLRNYAQVSVSVIEGGGSAVGPNGSIRWGLSSEARGRLVTGVARAAELWFSAGAREVLIPFARGPITTEAQASDLEGASLPRNAPSLLSLAQTGGAVMGEDPGASVVSPGGQVHGVRGLYVADASVIPVPLGVGPQMTVMALAARTAEHIAAAI